MSKISVSTVAVAIVVVWVLIVPSSQSFAQETFLQKLFSQQNSVPKTRRPRAARNQTTPVTVPLPEARPDNEPPVDDGDLGPLAPKRLPVPKQEASEDATVATPKIPPIPEPAPGRPVVDAHGKGEKSPEKLERVLAIEPNAGAETGQKSAPELNPVTEQATPSDETPETGPVPEPNPLMETRVPNTFVAPALVQPEKPEPKPMLPDSRTADRPDPAGMPVAELACRARLKTLGAEFADLPAESDTNIGCSIPYPITIKSLGKSIAITPAAEMNCAMAEASASFSQDVVDTAATASYGVGLKSISQASAYVCRPRHGTRKLSEHAFGNALDIAAFNLSDGTVIKVQPDPDEKSAKFLDAVRKAACGPFKTVLGPGSDADHALHFHLDLEPRRNGGTFCH